MPSLGHNFGKGQGPGEEGGGQVLPLGGRGDPDRDQQARCLCSAGSRSRLQVGKHRSVSDGIRASKRREDGQDEKKCRQGKDRQKGG